VVEGASKLEAGPIDGRVPVLEPGVQGSTRDHFLAFDDDGRAFRTEEEPPEAGRGRDEGGPAHALGELVDKLLIMKDGFERWVTVEALRQLFPTNSF